MDRRRFLHCAGLAVLAASGRLAPAAPVEERTPKDLSDLLKRIRREHQLPGLAAAVVDGDRIVAEGVAGVRQVGTDDRITLDDRFMIGSCTKRMTAAMICRLIDAGKLAFDTALADALPEIPMRDDYRQVTVAQLLTFTGGIQPYTRPSPEETPILFELKGSVAEQRERFVEHVLQEEPVAKPGTERRYSNASYAVAAFVASQRTGRSWEALMQEEVFKPLHLTKAGFGRPRSQERPNEPRRHIKEDQGYRPEPEGHTDPLAFMAGPGRVHCSIRDLARFAAYELSAAQGNDPLLKPATARRWRELSRGGPGEGRRRRAGGGPEGRREPPPGQQVKGRPVFGGSPWVTASYVLWPGENRAAAVAVNGGSAREACLAFFKAVQERQAAPAG
jgi:CubicO group peptidase (beta-lactamase class C family)